MAPYHTGIGGGGIALVRDRDGRYEAIDFRESAPAAASEDMYAGNAQGSVTSGLAVAVPGQLRGLEYIHRKYCVSRRLSTRGGASLTRVTGIAVEDPPGAVCEDCAGGFQRCAFSGRSGCHVSCANLNAVSEDMLRYMGEATEDGNFFLDDPVWAEQWAPNGKCSLTRTAESTD